MRGQQPWPDHDGAEPEGADRDYPDPAYAAPLTRASAPSLPEAGPAPAPASAEAAIEAAARRWSPAQTPPRAEEAPPNAQPTARPKRDDGRAAWFARLERLTEAEGDFLRLGARHWALFVDAGPTLIVGFETVEEAQARLDGMPLAQQVAGAHGWSSLTLLAEGETWWRDRNVWGYFDRLVDDAFFEDFDRVLFLGAGTGAYAACAFSVAAPGATVLAFAPRATMDPHQAGWDNRHPGARRLDFHSRYGYGPEMIEAAAQTYLVYDPRETLDAMHVALFRGVWITRLPMRFAGGEPAEVLAGIGALVPVVEAACEGRLTPALFAKAWRGRRFSLPYLSHLLRESDDAGKLALSELLCRSVTRRMNAPKFARRIEQIEAVRALRG